VVISLNAQVYPGLDNLKHQWSFEEGSTDDEVGGAHGVLVGATIVNGDLVTEGEATVDGADNRQYLELPPDEIGISGYTAASIEAWFTLTNKLVTWQMVVYLGDSTNGVGGNGWFISPARGDNFCRAAISCGNPTQPWTAESGVNWNWDSDTGEVVNVKVHCVTTIDGDSLYEYINGEKIGGVALGTANSLGAIGSQLALIGRGGYWGDGNFSGKTHKVAIWDKAFPPKK